MANCAPEIVRFSVFELDQRSGELRKHGSRVKLEGQPLRLLTVLVARPGEVVSREEVRQELWSDDTFVDFEHSINSAVRRLRHVLDDSADTPRFIETIPRRGYRFIYPLETGPLPPSRTGSAPAEEPPRARFHWPVGAYVLLAGVMIASILVGSEVAGLRSRDKAANVEAIAVLPFHNLSADPADEYLADGIAEELIADLSQIRSFKRVTSRTSAFSYKNTSKPVAEIGRDLNVGVVVEGSVARSGQHIRVDVQLVDTVADRPLWTKRYERDSANLFEIQSDIARQVAREIDAKLSPQQQQRLKRRAAVNVRAHQEYLKARYLHSKWDNRDNLNKAVERYSEAIRLQPDYAAAHAGQSLAYLFLAAALMEVERPSDVIPKAKAAAQRALQLDPESAEAYEAVGWLAHNHEWDWAAAERDYRQAIELNPNYAPPYVWLGHLLQTVGRAAEGPPLMERAHELDPLSPHIEWSIAESYMLAGEMKKAEEKCQEALALHADFWPAHALLGNIYLWQKDYGRAIASMRTAVEVSKRHPYTLGMLASAYALAGRRAEALAIVSELKQLARRQYVAPPVMVRAYASLGNKVQAMEWMNKSYLWRCSETPRVPLWGPVVASLRGYPPYEELLKKLNVGAPAGPAPGQLTARR